MKEIHEEIEKVISSSAEKVAFEEMLDEEFSPLNQPVVENEIGHGKEVGHPHGLVRLDPRRPHIDDIWQRYRSGTDARNQGRAVIGADDFQLGSIVVAEEIGTGQRRPIHTRIVQHAI